MTDYIGAIDQGTSGTRFVVFDQSGRPAADAFTKLTPRVAGSRRVEYDPVELWGSVTDVVHRVLASGTIGADDLSALAVANQRQTTVVWERSTGRPVAAALSWQDRRTADRITSLEPAVVDLIHERTGLIPDPYFAAPKLAWLLEHGGDRSLRERANAGEILFGTVDSWLLYNLTGSHVTDVTNAAQTMLFDIESLAWDDDLLDVFGVPREMLPSVRPSSDPEGFGRTDPDGVLAAEVPVTGVLGDQQAALVGQAGFEDDTAKVTYGSGNFFLQNTGTDPVWTDSGLLTTIWFQQVDGDPWYGLEGPVFTTGTTLEWLDEVGLLDDPGDLARLARAVESPEGVFVLPAFDGLGAPEWNPAIRTAVVGMSRGTRPRHIVRAAVEGIAFQTRGVIEAAEATTGVEHERLLVDGGAIYDDDFGQLQADVVGRPLVRPAVTQTTALGAAFVAGLAIGTWDSVDAIRNAWESGRTIRPETDADAVDTRYRNWSAVAECVQALHRDIG